MAANVTDLPMELLVKIFSFLNRNEILKLSIVCSNFNTAATDPSFWRKCEVSFYATDERKISSFCSFFSQHPHLRELSIHTYSAVILCPEVLNALNQLFKNLNHLDCLNVDFSLKNVLLPPSLRHLNCKVNGTKGNWGKEQFSFLRSCPNIERLYLETAHTRKLSKDVKSSLLKYSLSLHSFYIKIGCFDNGWIPLITNCRNLKELGLEMTGNGEANLVSLFGTPVRSRLEVLLVQNVSTLQSFSDFEFPELKHLTMANVLWLGMEECFQVIKKMPKLETLRLSGRLSYFNVTDFCNFLNNCKTLKYLVLEIHKFSSQEALNLVSKMMESGGGSENRWKVGMQNYEKKSLMSLYKCFCWNPTKNLGNILDGQTQRTILWIHEDEDDDNDFRYELDDNCYNFDGYFVGYGCSEVDSDW